MYFLYLPFWLGLFGAGVWFFPTDFMFVLGALVGSLAGIYILIDIVFRSAPLRLTTIYGMTILLAYNLGSLNSWLTLQRGSLSLAEVVARDPAVLGRALGVCMATAAILLVVGELFERPIFGSEFHLKFESGTISVVLSTTLLLAAAYASGKLSFMGLKIDENGRVNPATQLIVWWFTPAYAYAVCALLNTRGLRRWIVGGLVLIQTVALVPLGRRQFAFSLLLALIASRLGRFRLRLPVYKIVLIGIAASLLVTAASLFFFSLRVAGWKTKGKAGIPFAQRLERGYDLLVKNDPAEIFALMGSNVSHRTFVIGFFSDLLEASQHSTPLLGQDLLYNLQSTVPSAISADKFGISQYDEESMANMQWGFSYIDEANSLLTAGAADFGFLGVLLYPLALTFMLRAAAEAVQYLLPAKMAVIVCLAYIYQSLLAETVPLEYFLQIRTTILIALLLFFLASLPRVSLRPVA
jgi:hypothetical protein